nr:MAG: capsid protein [Cressdnaviricota sp.]
MSVFRRPSRRRTPYTRITARGQIIRNSTRTTSSRGRSASKTRSKSKSKTKSGSRTKTKTKLNQKIETSRDGPISDSYVTYPMKKSFSLGTFKKIIAPQFNVFNSQGTLSWSIGQQQPTVVGQFYDANVINNFFTQFNAVFPATTTAAKTTKLYLKKLNAEALITNQTNDVVHMILYDCVARRDIFDAAYADPYNAWLQGGADAGLSSSCIYVGSNPFQTPGFTEFYKVIKVTNVDLHSGGHHRHKVKISPNKMMSNEVIQEFITESFATIGKLTCFTLAVCHGYPTNATAGSVVSTASGKIDYVWRCQYEWEAVQANRTTVTVENNLTTLASQAIITDSYAVAGTVTTV